MPRKIDIGIEVTDSKHLLMKIDVSGAWHDVEKAEKENSENGTEMGIMTEIMKEEKIKKSKKLIT